MRILSISSDCFLAAKKIYPHSSKVIKQLNYLSGGSEMKAASTQMQIQKQQTMVPDDSLWPQRMKTRAVTYLKKYDSCTQSILWAFML